MSDSDCHEAQAELVKDDEDAIVAFLHWVLAITDPTSLVAWEYYLRYETLH